MTDFSPDSYKSRDDFMRERDSWRARAEAAERVAEAADAWVKWEWENPVSGCDMELDDIQETCERLQNGMFTALKAWRATQPEGEKT